MLEETMRKKQEMKSQSSLDRPEEEANIIFMKRWLDALCSGKAEDRFIAVEGGQPFKESLSFASRRIRLAGQNFDSGLAMLTDGSVEIRSRIPMTRFRATVGLDDNPIARRMVLASVVFSIETAGRELWRSIPVGPADRPQKVDLKLDGPRSLVLKAVMVSESARALNGYWAHADYAGATVELSDGSVRTVARTLDEQRLEQAVQPPLSFSAGGLASEKFFMECSRELSVSGMDGGGRVCVVSFKHPSSGLTCRVEARQFEDFPAVEWTAYFINDSEKKSPLLEDVRALDILWPAPAPARLHCARGSDERPDDFQHVVEELGTIRSDLRTVRLDSGSAGRSSINFLPFMNMETDNEGLVIAIGWSGQWAAEIGREAQSGAMRLRSGMDGIHLRLNPGESIRTPRILLLRWQGEYVDGNNLLRRYLLKHCVPQFAGRPVEAPACLATWGGQPTPQHRELIKQLGKHNLQYDCYWVDAGWYGTSATPCPDVFSGEWWKVGDWRVNPHYHEKGLRPLSDSIHKSGMKFLLWLDMETALHGAPVTVEHPEWFLSKNDAPRKEGTPLLLNLGHPGALNYAIETVAGLIEKEGVDWYRQDFNQGSPIAFWRANDEPERQGMTQIRHIEGLYAFWDELRRRFPRMLIDNCSSGGRRIDLETVSRSIPLWRSDYGCFAEADPDGLQVHAAGLTLWVPLSGGGSVCPPGDTYYYRSNLSAALTDAGFCNDVECMNEFLAGKADDRWEWCRRMLADYYRARPLFYGDFYPLTTITTLPDTWLAYQLHRPDLDRGLVVAFRRSQNPHPTAMFRLRGLMPGNKYLFEDADTMRCSEFTYEELEKTGFKVSLPEPRSCRLVFYHAKKRRRPDRD